MRRIFAAALPLCLIVFLSWPVEARRAARHQAPSLSDQKSCDSDARCVGRHPTARQVSAIQDERPTGRSTANLADAVPALAAKAREIVQTCGSTVISVHRPGARVRGSGRPSLHARVRSEAVDMSGNPGCIYAQLQGWPGGVSTDYRSVGHVHFSLASDGREMGSRFAHYSRGHKHRRASRRGRG
jgi:hypothetical protein